MKNGKGASKAGLPSFSVPEKSKGGLPQKLAHGKAGGGKKKGGKC